jgi:hypothetical protein
VPLFQNRTQEFVSGPMTTNIHKTTFCLK